MPEESNAMRPFWSGTIAFGLVNVPVALFPGNRRDAAVSLRMLAPDGAALQRRYFCPEHDDGPLSSDEIVRGYEIESGHFVEIDDEELERLDPERTREISLQKFVPRDEIDPRFFDRAYLFTPSGPSSKAYRLLAEVMERSDRAGIATFVMRGKEYLVAILAEGGILRAETLRFATEVRSPETVGLPDADLDAAPSEIVENLEQAIEKLAADTLDPGELEDDSADAIRELAERKSEAGEGVVEVPEEAHPRAQVIDLMATLKKSLEKGADEAAREAS